jgi:predicted lipoprotein
MRALLVALLFMTPAVAQSPVVPTTPDRVAERAVDGFIRHWFNRFAEAAFALEISLPALCEEPSSEALAEARERFLDAVGGFGRVSFLSFGPLVADNRFERLLLWPDPRGIALRQVQQVLADMPDDALDPDALAGKSVALQGFNALEYVLFGTGAEEELTAEANSYRCRYGDAVGTAIRRVAEEISDEWHAADGISRRLMAPAASDPDYRSVREVLEELVGALSHGAEGVRDTQLLPFIGRDGAAPKPRSAPLWRSNGTLVLVASTLRGIVDFAHASGIAEAAGEQGPFLSNAIAFEGENVTRAEAVITGSVEEAVKDPAQLQGYKYLVILTQSLQSLIGEQLSAALGLSVGFSSLDGD